MGNLPEAVVHPERDSEEDHHGPLLQEESQSGGAEGADASPIFSAEDRLLI